MNKMLVQKGETRVRSSQQKVQEPQHLSDRGAVGITIYETGSHLATAVTTAGPVNTQAMVGANTPAIKARAEGRTKAETTATNCYPHPLLKSRS